MPTTPAHSCGAAATDPRSTSGHSTSIWPAVPGGAFEPGESAGDFLEAGIGGEQVVDGHVGLPFPGKGPASALIYDSLAGLVEIFPV